MVVVRALLSPSAAQVFVTYRYVHLSSFAASCQHIRTMAAAHSYTFPHSFTILCKIPRDTIRQLYEERPDKKRRAPAWCDRVLWRTRDAGHVGTVSYSRGELLLSDHKPVCAELSVKVCTSSHATLVTAYMQYSIVCIVFSLV